MCGEHTAGVALCLRQKRDHPRMCGEHKSWTIMVWACSGSSPHVRGAHQREHRPDGGRGIIPACAGSTWVDGDALFLRWDHPRMCGEHGDVVEIVERPEGSSPHVRGARSTTACTSERRGIIPACAGSTCVQSTPPPVSRDHPRMCGEHSSR